MLTNKQISYAKLNIAVIGCGNWGKNHLRVLHELGALYALADTAPATVNQFSEQYQVPQYTLTQIVNDPKIDGVVIATPAESHAEIALACLEGGKHLFIEKPLSLDLTQAKHIYEQAIHANKVLMVGHILHYHAAFMQLKALIQAGELGTLQYLYSNRLNLGKFRTEEDIWWSFAPHDVSMILALIDEMPQSVSAFGSKFLKHTTSDVTCTHLAFPKGQQAHIFVSWLHPYKEQKLVVVGDAAMAIFDDGQPWASKLRLHPYPAAWTDGLPRPASSEAINIALPESEPLKEEIKHFLECIYHQQIPLSDGKESLRVLTILNAAANSIAQHQPIFIEPLV